jgi:putative PIN family toxin of toxin-antitoxin system
MIPIVIDTNVFVSAYLKGGLPLQVIDSVYQQQATALTTQDMLEELRTTLLRPKFIPYFSSNGVNITKLLDAYASVATLVTPIAVDVPLRDDKDYKVLACALGGKAEYIITGDKDLLTLQTLGEILIITPQDYLKRINFGE